MGGGGGGVSLGGVLGDITGTRVLSGDPFGTVSHWAWDQAGGGGSGPMDMLTGQSGTDAAIKAQNQAAADANATQRYIFDQTRADQEPWKQAGMRALTGMENADYQRDFTMNDFQKDPGYDFRMAEGMKALQNSAAAKGSLNSGATLKALSRYGQDFASNEYQNAYNRFNSDRDRRFNRLASLAGTGQTANNQVASAGQNYGNNVSQNQIGMGNANAAANISQANRNSNLLMQGGMAALAFSDARLKKNVRPVPWSDLVELRKAIKPYIFEYVSESFGEGEWVGAMAQDIEKTKLGKRIVFEDEHGNKKIDLRKIGSLMLATMAMEGA